MVIFDVVLIVVLGLLLYSLSARERDAAPSWFDGLQLVMVLLALVIDVIVLVAMISRIGEFGASANKLASLGLNLILLVNLAGAAWLHFRFLRRRTRYSTLERWQTSYIPVYLGVGRDRRGRLPAGLRLRVAPGLRRPPASASSQSRGSPPVPDGDTFLRWRMHICSAIAAKWRRQAPRRAADLDREEPVGVAVHLEAGALGGALEQHRAVWSRCRKATRASRVSSTRWCIAVRSGACSSPPRTRSASSSSTPSGPSTVHRTWVSSMISRRSFERL